MLSGLLVLAGASLTACGGGPVEVDSPQLDQDQAAACTKVLDALPDSLADQSEREVEPADALARAYGDPAIVVSCAAEPPPEFNDFSQCDEVDGVGWFIPEAMVADQDAEATMTALSYEPIVEISMPSDYRPDGVPSAMVEVSTLIKQHLTEVDACH